MFVARVFCNALVSEFGINTYFCRTHMSVSHFCCFYMDANKLPSCFHSAAVLIRQVLACFLQRDQLIKVVWKNLLLEFMAWNVSRLAHKVFFLNHTF